MRSGKTISLEGLSDEEAINLLFEECYTPLCRTAYRIVRSEAAAEDIVQEVFLKCWDRKFHRQVQASLFSYLYRSVLNTAFNYLEKNRRSVASDMSGLEFSSSLSESADDQLNLKELETRVEAAIEALPPRCRVIFTLSRYEEKSYKEIADDLDISVNTVENQMAKALKILRSKLSDYLHMLHSLLF